ncbi:hypothetical protein yberc0001_4720 [Yersinia bercovieri ATCC 43970]|uniref:Uncharacterized protein n=1 Tax=Yersinia bercovieri ATCC 43970 TaxID=349968 RepID=A0ABP2E3B9_YERBE|nr:hypothetical protein yberc0001_4720 [Yersinia bercovieri ATCC 43970]
MRLPGRLEGRCFRCLAAVALRNRDRRCDSRHSLPNNHNR